MSSRLQVTITKRRGVRVEVRRVAGRGSTVLADCQCFGHDCRVHSNPGCPNRPKEKP